MTHVFSKLILGIAMISTILPAATIVNVKNFGATGDGITDDTAAIQQAVSAFCQANVGASLFFPKGHYLVGKAEALIKLKNIGNNLQT